MVQSKIFVAGHRGMVGSAITRLLRSQGQNQILTRSRDELDLTHQSSVRKFFESERPDMVFVAAAKVGGIRANNTFPADFIYENLAIQTNIISEAFNVGVKRLLFLGSSCVYPKTVSQPMTEDMLLTGVLEATNEPYAIAKIAGIKLCESYNRQFGESHGIDYRSIMPTNLYGPGDNYDPEGSHVIPALIRKIHEAKAQGSKQIVLWGTGLPKREFLFVDDLAHAAVHLMSVEKHVYQKNINPMISHYNAGSGEEISINALAELISGIIGYAGKIEFDKDPSEGPLRKLLDSSRLINLGWSSKVTLASGLAITYDDYLKHSTG